MKSQRFFRYGKSIVFTLAVILFLADQLTKWKNLSILLSLVSILAILLSLLSCKVFTRLLSIIFLALGTWMVWEKGIDFLSYIRLYGDMLYLLSLFAIVPLLSIPIQVGGYQEVFKHLFRKRVKSVSQLYRVVTTLSYFLGTFLNMATIPIIYSGVKSVVEAWPIRNPKRFLASGIIQGYSLPIIWTPFSGIVGVVLHVTQVRWLHIFPLLFFISLATLVLNWILFSVIEGSRELQVGHEETAAAKEQEFVEDSSFAHCKLLQIVAVIVLLLFLVVSIDTVFSVGLVIIVTLLTVPFAWLWCLFLRKNRPFWLEARSHFRYKVPEMSESFAIFLSAGFFVGALHYSENDQLVNQLFVELNNLVGVHLFVFLLPYITLFLSYVGLHPIVAVHLLAQSLTTDVLGITNEQMAVAFLGGAVMTFFVGPFSGTLGLMSSMIKVGPLRIARWNVIYVIGFSFIVAAAILWL